MLRCAFLGIIRSHKPGNASEMGILRVVLQRTSSFNSPLRSKFADLGSRTGDGQAKGLHRSHEGASLLLRSTKSLVTRHHRKHPSAPMAILPARHRPVWFFASAARPGLAALESTAQKNIGIRNSRT